MTFSISIILFSLQLTGFSYAADSTLNPDSADSPLHSDSVILTVELSEIDRELLKEIAKTSFWTKIWPALVAVIAAVLGFFSARLFDWWKSKRRRMAILLGIKVALEKNRINLDSVRQENYLPMDVALLNSLVPMGYELVSDDELVTMSVGIRYDLDHMNQRISLLEIEYFRDSPFESEKMRTRIQEKLKKVAPVVSRRLDTILLRVRWRLGELSRSEYRAEMKILREKT